MSLASGPLVPALAFTALLWPRLVIAASPAAPPASFPTASFATEKEAEQHCQADLAVWLDLPSRPITTGASSATARQRTGLTSAATRRRRRRCGPLPARSDRPANPTPANLTP